MNKRIFIGILILSTVSTAKFVDSDLDGVSDDRDKCPGTPFLVLVDKYGCPIEKYRGKFYLRLGSAYSRDRFEERASLLVSFGYSYRRFYGSITGRYYAYSKNLGSGLGDTSLYGSYRFTWNGLYLIPGLRFRIPTGDARFTDGYVDTTFSTIVNYIKGNLDLFLYGSYTIRSNPNLENTYTLSGGPGYYSGPLYANLTFDAVKSSFGNYFNTYISTFLLLDLSKNLYSTFSYSYGLTDRAVDHSAVLRIGLRF